MHACRRSKCYCLEQESNTHLCGSSCMPHGRLLLLKPHLGRLDLEGKVAREGFSVGQEVRWILQFKKGVFEMSA